MNIEWKQKEKLLKRLIKSVQKMTNLIAKFTKHRQETRLEHKHKMDQTLDDAMMLEGRLLMVG